MKLFLYEFRKIFTAGNRIVFFAALALQALWGFFPHVYEHEYSPEIYRRYMERIGGVYTEEKRTFLEARREEIAGLIDAYEEMEGAYKRDEIALDEFERYLYEYQLAESERSTVDYLLEKCSYYDSLDGEAVFFYDTDWADFFSHSGYPYLLAAVLFLLLIPVFDREFTSNARPLLLPAVSGRKKLCICKLAALALTGFAVPMVFFALRYAVFVCQAGGGQDFCVRNLLGYSGYPDISLAQYYFTDALAKAAAWSVGALLLGAVSNIVRNTVFSFFLSVVCMVSPAWFAGIWPPLVYEYAFCAAPLGKMYGAAIDLRVFALVCLLKAAAYILINLKYWEKEASGIL